MPIRLTALCLCLLTTAAAAAASDYSAKTSLIAQYYPPESLALGEEGTVEFTLELSRNGRIESCGVTKSSGYRRLDLATCDLLVGHAHFAPSASKGPRVATAKTGQLVWRLPEAQRRNGSPPPLETVTEAELQAQRLICRRTKMPGSLVRLKTFCLTQDQWVQATADAQQQSRDMLSTRQSDHGCAFGPGC